MAEMKKKLSSFPSNYVTLQQLQERRLKERQQKLREKEDEERRKREKEEEEEQRQKEKEEEDRRRKLQEEEEERRKLLEEQRLKEELEMKREKEEKERKLHKTRRAQAIEEASASVRPNRWNSRRFSKRKPRIWKEIGSETTKGEGVAVGIAITADGGISDDEGQKPEESKQQQQQKKKPYRKRYKKKTMTHKTEEKSEAGSSQPQAENGNETNQIPVEPKEEIKRVRKKKMEPKLKEKEASAPIMEENGHDEKPVTVQRRSKGPSRASAVKKDSANVTKTIAQELGDLAIADQHKQQEEENLGGSMMALRAGNGSYYGGGPKWRRGRWFGGNGRRFRDGSGGLVWMKKGETSNGNNGIQKAIDKSKPNLPCVS